MKIDEKYFEQKFRELFYGFPEVATRKNILRQIARDQREASIGKIQEISKSRNSYMIPLDSAIAALREEDK